MCFCFVFVHAFLSKILITKSATTEDIKLMYLFYTFVDSEYFIETDMNLFFLVCFQNHFGKWFNVNEETNVPLEVKHVIQFLFLAIFMATRDMRLL